MHICYESIFVYVGVRVRVLVCLCVFLREFMCVCGVCIRCYTSVFSQSKGFVDIDPNILVTRGHIHPENI